MQVEFLTFCRVVLSKSHYRENNQREPTDVVRKYAYLIVICKDKVHQKENKGY